jgi:hypothetical protein
MYFRNRLLAGFTSALVDDWFVRLDPALDRVGIGLKELGKGMLEQATVKGQNVFLERVDCRKVVVYL